VLAKDHEARVQYTLLDSVGTSHTFVLASACEDDATV